MKRIALLILFSSFLAASASAYYMSIDVPEQLQVGLPLQVNGTTNIPPGIMMNVYLSYNPSYTEEISRKSAYTQTDGTFKVIFDTTGLRIGQYKVEVRSGRDYPLSSDSTDARTVKMVNRMTEIELYSGTTQNYDGTLNLAGKIRTLKNQAVLVTITNHQGAIVYGPEYIPVMSDGGFSLDVPVTSAGQYDVSFTDTKSYIGFIPVNLISADTPALPKETTVMAPNILTASAYSGRDSPAYFKVEKPSGDIRFSTSPGVDWIIEFTDGTGTIQRINAHDRNTPETVALGGGNWTMYVRVLPSTYSESGIVTLTVENADTVEVLPAAPEPFAPASASPTKAAGMLPGIAVALPAAILFLKRR